MPRSRLAPAAAAAAALLLCSAARLASPAAALISDTHGACPHRDGHDAANPRQRWYVGTTDCAFHGLVVDENPAGRCACALPAGRAGAWAGAAGGQREEGRCAWLHEL